MSKFSTDFRKQQDYIDAQKGVDDANRDLDAARAAMDKKLASSSGPYKAAKAKEAAADTKLQEIRDNGGSKDDIAEQATIKMNAGTDADNIEQAALDADIPYSEAKKKLADAAATKKALEDKLADAIKADDNISQLKDKMDTAKSALDDARTKLASDRK